MEEKLDIQFGLSINVVDNFAMEDYLGINFNLDVEIQDFEHYWQAGFQNVDSKAIIKNKQTQVLFY